MNRTAHKITRIVFEIGLRGRERATTTQNRVSAFAGGALETVLIQSLSALAGENQLLAVDRIELNIGKVSYQHLEEDLAAGIARGLRAWAFRSLPPHRLQSIAPVDGPKQSDGARARGPHLLPGPDAPPSAGIIASRGGLNAAVASALKGPGDWRQLLAAIRENHAFRGRLASEVSPQLLKDMLRSLVPAYGTAMAEIASVLITLHDHAALVPADRQSFRRVLWECVLTEAARSQSGGFSMRAFTTGVLRLLAARHSMPVSALTTRIANQLQKVSGSIAASITLANILHGNGRSGEPGLEWQPAPSSDGSSDGSSGSALTQSETDSPSSRPSHPLEDLARFLEWGIVPWSTRRATRYSAEPEMLKCLASSPDDVCALVHRLGENPSVRKRLAGQFSDKIVHRLFAALDPVNASWMTLCTLQLRRLHAQKPLFRLQNQAFSQLLWELAFEYLAERHWHALNAVAFLRFLLQRLAARQKTSYELVLADLVLRRNPEPHSRRAAKETGPQSLLNATILTLLEEDVLGIRGRLSDTPRMVVQPEFHHLYSDLDVLAYWLRWRRLPSWSQVLSPEETARLIGPLLGELPPAIRKSAGRDRVSATVSGPPAQRQEQADDALPLSSQIERWLLYGIWPEGVNQPRTTALTEWLEQQQDSDWREALRRCGAQEQVVQRIINHLPPAFLSRAIGILSGPSAEAVCSFLRSLQAAGRHIAGAFSPPWREQVDRYSLAHLLKIAASPGHPAASIEELAHETLCALSLRCQISCDRILLLLERESQSQPLLRELCLHLREEFASQSRPEETSSPSHADVAGEGMAGAADQKDVPPCLLQYLQYGSLPESAASLDFRSLQQLAGRCDDSQMASIAHSLLPLITRTGGIAVAQRAAALFPTRAFLRLASVISPGLKAVADLDRAFADLALRVSLPSPVPRTAGRALLLQAAVEHSGSADQKAIIASLLIRLATYAHVSPARMLDEMTETAGQQGRLRALLDEARRDARFSNAVHGGSESTQPEESVKKAEAPRQQGGIDSTSTSETFDGPGEQPASPPTDHQQGGADHGTDSGTGDDVRGRLDALAHLLRTGNLPWWNEIFAPVESSRWLRPLLESHSRPLLGVLRSVSTAPQAIDRLMRYMPQTDLKEIVQKAAPDYGGLIILYIETGSELAADASLSATQRGRANAIHWREALAFLLDEQPTGRTPSEALRALCDHVARQLGLSNDEYLKSMTQAARRRIPAKNACATLAEMLSKLQSTAKSGTSETASTERPAEDSGSAPSHPAFPDEITTTGQLEYFLRYGSLPPSVTETRSFIDSFIGELNDDPRQFLPILRASASHDVERRRIARLLPAEALNRLWPILLPADHAHAVSVLEGLHAAAVLAAHGTPEAQLRQTCVEELLRSSALSQGRRWEMALYIRGAIDRLVAGHSLRAAEIMERLREKTGSFFADKEAIEKFKIALDRVERETSAIPVRPRRQERRFAPEGRPADRPWKRSTPFPPGEPFHIGNAGAILLWPFLGRYFQNLGLMEKNAFPGEPERSRAVYLVQYLATGNIEVPENELLLNKILCGAQPEQALEPVAPITEAEELLSKEMLQAVIANWPKLRNTSIEGLRQSFLAREGRLLRRDSDDSWSLTVSTRGYDVLLDSLPWRLSTVRQPWMQTVLHVKWR